MTDAPATAGARVAAVILAAGWSSRMGAFKPLLPFGGSTVLGHTVGIMRAAGIDDIFVVIGNEAEAMKAEATRLGVVAVTNADFDSGMFSSVKAGVAAVPADVAGIVLLPVDIPLLRSSTVARVVEAARGGDAPVVHPIFRGERGHPPFIRRTLFDEILTGQGRLRDILERHVRLSLEVPVFDRGCLSDMDYPEDYARLKAALARHVHPDALECEAMLEAACTPPATRRHCRAVAMLAADIARRLVETGVALDVGLVEAAARLHDIDKGEADHAAAGAARLAAFGFAEVAEVVKRHMELPVDEPPLSAASIVYLADKLIQGESRVTPERRFAPAFARFAGNAEALAGARRRFAAVIAVKEAVEARIDLSDEATNSERHARDLPAIGGRYP